jgi:hypothetical protein
MSSSEFNLADGSWMGTASDSMDAAFAALEGTAIQLANSCWDMGESINYYAILRTQQENTEAKEWLKEELLGIFGALAILLLPLDGIIGAALDAMADLIGVADLAAAAAEAVTSFATDAAGFLLESVGVDADALTIPSWVGTMADVAAGIADAGINYTIYNAVTEAAATGIAGLPVGPSDLSPIPTNGSGWAELIGMISLGGLGPLLKDGEEADGAGKGTTDPDISTGTVSGGGGSIPKVNPDGAPTPKPEVGPPAGAGKITEGPGGSITNHGATVTDGQDIAHQAPSFGGSVDIRTDSPVSDPGVSVNGLSDGGASHVTQVKSDEVNLNDTSSADAGFKNDITDTSSSPATSNAGPAVKADLSHDGPVSGDPETRTVSGTPATSASSTPEPGQRLGGGGLGPDGVRAARVARFQGGGEAGDGAAALERGGGSSGPSVAVRPKGDSGRGYDYPATIHNGDDAGADAAPGASVEAGPRGGGRGYDYPATVGDGDGAGAAASGQDAAGSAGHFSEPGQRLGGGGLGPDGVGAARVARFGGGGGVGDGAAALERGGGSSGPSVAVQPKGDSGRGYDYPATIRSGDDAGADAAPGASVEAGPRGGGRGYDYPATIDNAGQSHDPSVAGDHFSGSGQRLGGTNLSSDDVREVRAQRLEGSGEVNRPASTEGGRASGDSAPLTSSSQVPAMPRPTEEPRTAAGTAKPTDSGSSGSASGYRPPSGSRPQGGLQIRGKSSGSATMTIKPEPARETPAVSKPAGTEEPKAGTGSRTGQSDETVTGEEAPATSQDSPRTPADSPLSGPPRPANAGDAVGQSGPAHDDTATGHGSDTAVDHGSNTDADHGSAGQDESANPGEFSGSRPSAANIEPQRVANDGQSHNLSEPEANRVSRSDAGTLSVAGGNGLTAATMASAARLGAQSASSPADGTDSAVSSAESGFGSAAASPADSGVRTTNAAATSGEAVRNPGKAPARPGPPPDNAAAQADHQVQAVLQAAQDGYLPLFDRAGPQEYFGFLAAQAHLQTHDGASGAPGADLSTGPVTQDPAEAAWQAWLNWAREQFPGTAPVRPDMTIAETVDWINSHSHAMAAEAAGSYMERFDGAGGQRYINFHWGQAREHARNIVLSDLGVDVQRWLSGDVRPHQAPKASDDDGSTQPPAPALVIRGVRQPDFAELDSALLPTRGNGGMLPTFNRGTAVGGVFSASDGGLLLDGRVRTPAETAQWIRRWTSWSDDAPAPVVLIGGGAGEGAEHGAALPEFTALLAAELGVPVIASSGSMLQTPEGRFHAGTAVTGGDGQPALVSVGGDSWVIYEPDGSAHPVGPDLDTVATWLGLGMEAPARNPAVPTLWNRGVPTLPRDGSGTNVYPEIPMSTWATAASLVQRWDHYPIIINTGLGPAIERYQHYRDIAAVAQVLIDGTRVPHLAESDPAASSDQPWGGLLGGSGGDVEMTDAPAGLAPPAAGPAGHAGGGDSDVEMTDAPPSGPAAVRALERWFSRLQQSDSLAAQRIQPDVERTAVVLRELDDWMRANELGYRFGGSLSALLQGAPRLPQDIDIEVTNRANMQALFGRVSELGSGWSFTSSAAADGEVVAIFAQHASTGDLQFDIVNETHPVAFGQAHQVHEMMQLEGDAVVSGDLTPADELILNYLDRMLKKPDRAVEKNDAAQVVGLLRGTGVDGLDGAAQYWARHLEPAIQQSYPRTGDLREAFRQTVLNGFTGDAARPGPATGHWGPTQNLAAAEALARRLGRQRGVGGPHGGLFGGAPAGGETGTGSGALVVAPPPEQSHQDPVSSFGAERDGAQSLSHVDRIQDDTIEYLLEHITRIVERTDGPDQEFRDGLGTWLTPELLVNEWARLRSISGLPVKVPYKGRKYPAAIRMEPRLSGPGDPGMKLMPDGAPVQIQRWGVGVAESGSTATSTELRSLNQGFQTGWTSVYKDLLGVTVNARVLFTHGQMAEQPTVTQTDQSQQLLTSRGASDPFNFTMMWQVRLGDSVSTLFAGTLPDDHWDDLPPAPLKPLRVWFPKYSSADQAAANAAQSADPAARRPAPIAALRHQFPHYGVITVRNHDQLLADVAASFPLLHGLSEDSREDLLRFLSEGDLRSYIPNAWGGYVASPTLYDKWGNPLGYLRYRVNITGGDDVTGPVAANSVMQSYVLRSRRAVQSAAVTDAAGVQFPTTLTLGSPSAPDGSAEGLVTVQPGYQHSFTHTLGSGGSARVASSIRSKQDLLEVTADVVFYFDFVQPHSSPLRPTAGSPLSGGNAYQAQMLVPSQALVNGKPIAARRHLPPELENLTHIPLTTTPLEVAGTDGIFARAETLLRTKGYLPPDRADSTMVSRLSNSNAALGQLLDNQRRFDQFRSSVGLRGKLSDFVEGAGSVWFQAGNRRIRLNLAVTRRKTGPESAVRHERSVDVSSNNYTGSTLSGDEQFNRTPGNWNLTVSAGAENVLSAAGGGVQPFKEILGEGVGSAQKSSIVDSSSGTAHEDYLTPPVSQGSEFFKVPARFVMMAHEGEHEIWHQEANGHVRLAVPVYRTLDAPHTENPPAVTVRAADAADQAALGHAPATGEDGMELVEQGRSLYRNGRLRIPQSAIIDGMAGSRELTQAVIGTLNGQTPGGTAAVTAGNAAAEDPEDDEDDMPRIPGAFPRTNQGPVLPAPATHPLPQAQAPAADGMLAQWQRRAFDFSLVTPESFTAELLETVLSPAFLKAHGQRILRDRMVVEGVATPGRLADRTFTISLSAYLRDAEVIEATDEMDAERWQQSSNVFSHADSTTTSLGLGAVVEGNYGDSQDFQPSFEPSGTYVGSVSWNKSETVSGSTSVWRVVTEEATHGYRARGTVVYVAEITQTWRNVFGGVVTETALLVRNAVGALTGSTSGEAALLSRTDTLAVEVPEGIEFILFKNDFHAHPELLTLPGMDSVPADRRPGEAPEDDRVPPRWFVNSGGVIGNGVPSEVEFHDGRGALEKVITDLVRQVAPGAVQAGFNTSLNGVQTRINQVSTGHGPTAVVNAGPNGRVAFHWLHRDTTGHRLIEVAVTARPRVDLSAISGRALAKTSGIGNVIGHANAEGSSIGKPGVVTESNTQSRTHTLTASGLSTEGSPGEGTSSRSQGPSLNLTFGGSTTGRSHTAPREVRAWNRTTSRTNQYNVEYDYHVEVTSRSLNEAAIPGLQNLPAIVTSWVIDKILGDGTVEELLSRLPYAEWFVPGMTYRRRADVRADVYLRFNDSETPKPGHVQQITPVTPQVLPHNPAQPPARAADDTPGLVALRGHLSGQPWAPTRPIAVYDFNGYSLLQEALRAVDPRLANAQQAQLTESVEARNIVLTGWAGRGAAADLTLAEAGHFLSVTPKAWTATVGRAPASRTRVTLMIYDPLIELSSRDQAIDDIKIATDGFGPTASTTSNPSLTFNVTDPLRGSTVDSVRGPSVPLLGQSRARGEYAQQASLRRRVIRYGTPAENARLEGLPGHLIHGVAVITLDGPQGTRWVVGNLLFRATEKPTGAASAYPDVTLADVRKASTARREADHAAADRTAEAEAAAKEREQAERQLTATSSAQREAERKKAASDQAAVERTAEADTARTRRDEAAQESARLANGQVEAEASRDKAGQKANRMAEQQKEAEAARDDAVRKAKGAEDFARMAAIKWSEAIRKHEERQQAAQDTEAKRAAAVQRLAELRSAQQPQAERAAGEEGGDEPHQARPRQAASELAAAENQARELTSAAETAKTELETAERELTAAEEEADKQKREGEQAANEGDAAVRKAAAAVARSEQANADHAAAVEKAEKAKTEAAEAKTESEKAEEEARKQEAGEQRAREQAQTYEAALRRAQAAQDAANNTAIQRQAAESDARSKQKAAATKAENSRAAQMETERRAKATAGRHAARDNQSNAASALNLDDAPLGSDGTRTLSGQSAAGAATQVSPGQPSPRPVVRLDPRIASRTTAAPRQPVSAGPPAPAGRSLSVTPTLVPHTFNLAMMAARNGGSTDPARLVVALERAIKDAVEDAEGLGRAELTLEAGEPGLIAVGLEVAQTVARKLKHRILFISGPGAPPVNICP